MENTSNVTARRIAEVRRARGWTQTKLAGMIDTRPATVSDIEGSKRQVGRWLAPLAVALDVTADYLLGLADTWHGPEQASEIDLLPDAQRQAVCDLVRALLAAHQDAARASTA